MYEILRANEDYSIKDAVASSMNYRKIHEDKLKSDLFRKLEQLVEPGQYIRFGLHIDGIKPLPGQDEERIYLRGIMLVEIESKEDENASEKMSRMR